MRCVTGNATFRLYWSMLENKRTGFVSVTTKADLVLSRRRAQLASEEAAVRIMAIAACQQTFIDAMVDRFGELRPYFKVASVAEHWLRHLQ